MNEGAKEVSKHTIIWDFDGTILPLEPYDSEQALLMHLLDRPEEKMPFFNLLFTRFVVYADRKEWFRRAFKMHFERSLRGRKIEILDRFAEFIATTIPMEDRNTYHALKDNGHEMVVLSCGTADLSERILKAAGIGSCFNAIEANRFRIEGDEITGVEVCMPEPEDKVGWLEDRGIHPNETIVVGDGYTDLPLLEWTENPVMIDRFGNKRPRYGNRGFTFISSIPEVVPYVQELASSSE